jgi:hemoglobin
MERAREDVLLGPIFNTAVSDWDHHISKIADVWSSIVLKTGHYDGRPMRPHLLSPLKSEHFDCWLALFGETAREIFSPAVSEAFLGRARLMADSFVMAKTSSRGEIARLRHGDRKS